LPFLPFANGHLDRCRRNLPFGDGRVILASAFRFRRLLTGGHSVAVATRNFRLLTGGRSVAAVTRNFRLVTANPPQCPKADAAADFAVC
jgi:hypothetical protein